MSRLSPTEIDYPAEDGVPMAETPLHVRAITLFHQAMEDFFAGRPDVFIASDIFWYWEEGNVNARTAPDTLVAIGIEPKPLADRRSYLQWKENGIVPSLVFETASKGTWRTDLAEKKVRYQSLGVPEYVVFDPQAKYLRTNPLRLFRLRRGEYRRAREVGGELASGLGFRMRAEGELPRLIDGQTGRPIPTRAEAVEVARREAADTARLLEEAHGRESAALRQAEAAARREAAAHGLVAEAQRQRAEALQETVSALRQAVEQKARADALATEVARLQTLHDNH